MSEAATYHRVTSKLGNTHDSAGSDDDLDGELHGGSTWFEVANCERDNDVALAAVLRSDLLVVPVGRARFL